MNTGMALNGLGFKALAANLADDVQVEIHFDTGITEGLQRLRGKVRSTRLVNGVLIIEASDNQRPC